MQTTDIYLKFQNNFRKHFDFQYVDGFNCLKNESFEGDPHKTCCAGGLYIVDTSNKTNILKFTDFGNYVSVVELPGYSNKFLMVKDFFTEVVVN